VSLLGAFIAWIIFFRVKKSVWVTYTDAVYYVGGFTEVLAAVKFSSKLT
jgi:hypothetical protein